MEQRKRPIAFLDTHIVMWLFDARRELFTKKLSSLIDNTDLYVTPIVKLELQYLYEIKRIRCLPEEIMSYLFENIGLKYSNNEMLEIVNIAIGKVKWTRDPFDRVIVADAMKDNSLLITADKKILKNYKHAIF